MDTKALIKTLHDVFCDNNKTGKKYVQVWLEEENFDGLYESGKYVLCLKAEHEIDSCLDETQEVINLLSEKTPKELESIWRVTIFDMEDNIHCETDDLLVLDENNSCES
jgi:hypothetical protein